MGSEGSPEPIDFDFFAEDDDDFVKSGRNSRRRQSPLAQATAKSRPESAGSVRSAVSSRSSISVKIPSAGLTGTRENTYSTKGKHSDSSDNEYPPDDYQSGRRAQTNLNFVKNREIEDRTSSGDGKLRSRTSSSRPKTSKGSRVSHRRQDSSSSYGSSTSKSNPSHSSSFSSKSEHSDSSYTSISDSDSDVTDVSPLPSPARSPTPTLEYNQDEFEDSFEESRLKKAKTQSRDGRQNRTRSGKKESVRFAGVMPSNGSAAQRDKQMDETEARELSRLLRAVLELDDTPNPSQLHSYHRSTKQRPVSAKKATTSNAQPMPHQRVNLSFSNDKVRQIDRENQRLLQKILRRPKSGITSGAAPVTRREEDPLRLVSHSAICRQREQRKIEMDNMKILERIESAHACSTVQRNKLLHEHTKQMKYASQVSKGSVRPQSSRTSDYAQSSSLGKGSSMASLNSEASHISTGSAGSRRIRPSSGRSMPPPPRGPKQAWDDRW